MLAMDTFAAPDIMFGGGPEDGKGRKRPKKKPKPKQPKQPQQPKNKRATPDNESYFDIDPSEKGARRTAKRSPVSDELKFEASPKQAKTIRPASPAPPESDVTMSGSDEEYLAAPESDDAMSGSDEDYTPLGADLDVQLAKRNAYLQEALARKNAAKAQANEDAPLTHDPDAAAAQVDVMQLEIPGGDDEEELSRPPAASTKVPYQMEIDAQEDEDTAQEVEIDEEADTANRQRAEFLDKIRREKEAATVGMQEDDDADAQNRQVLHDVAVTLIVVQDQLSSVIQVLIEARAEAVSQHAALLLDVAPLLDAQATPEGRPRVVAGRVELLGAGGQAHGREVAWWVGEQRTTSC